MSFPERTRYLKASPATALSLLTLCFESARAEDAFENSNAALKMLYGREPLSKMIGEKAKAVLVFPNIVKAGFIIGRQYGEGVLLANGKQVARYNSVAASFGFHAGVRLFGYALFLMNDSALQCLDSSDGWQIGAGSNTVVVSKDIAKSLTATSLKGDAYAFIFERQGLRTGLGIQGSRITKLDQRSHS
jgi:lipid-binding SYLF domain-containing protein